MKDKKSTTIKAFQKNVEKKMSLVLNQIKYGHIKPVQFAIDQWNHGYKVMIKKFIPDIMKENLLLLKDLLTH